MLWLPQHGLGGAPPDAPLGFKYPDSDVYAQGFAKALSSVDNNWARDELILPVAATVPFLKGVAASAGGVANIAAVASGNYSGDAAVAITTAIAALMTGSLEIVQTLKLGQKASQAVGEVADAVPIIGAVVTLVVGWIVEAVKGMALTGAAEELVEQELHEHLSQWCPGVADSHKPYPTLSGQISSPADFFRRVAFSYQGDERLPLDAASMYVMLCGGETGGFGMSRTRWQQIVATARKANPKIGNGIPPAVQRTMWRIIKGIMATVQPPIKKNPFGDEGRALMPLLQETVRQYYLKATQGSGPGWDENLARLCSNEIAQHYRQSHTREVGAGVVQRQASCAGGHGYGPHIDLSSALVDSLIGFQAEMSAQFWDERAQAWTLGPKDPMMMEKSGAVVLGADTTEQTAGFIEGMFKKGGVLHKLLKVTLLGGIGYGSYRLVRHVGYKPGFL